MGSCNDRVVNFTIKQARTDGSVLSPESPSPSTKPRRSLTSKLRDTTESLRSRSKSRERVSADKSSSLKKDVKNKSVFSSTLSLFKKRERKKSYDEAIAASCDLDAPSGDHPSLESIGNVEFTFNTEKERRQDDSIFISLHADDRNYEEALPSESVSIPLETPTKLLDEYESEPCTGSIITEVSIEHYPAPVAKIRTEAQIETRSCFADSQLPQSASNDSQLSKSLSKDSKIGVQANKVMIETLPAKSSVLTKTSTPAKTATPSTSAKTPTPAKPSTPAKSAEAKSAESRMSSGTSKDSSGKRPDIMKPKRKGKDSQQQQQQQQQVGPSERVREDDDATQQKKTSLREAPPLVAETAKRSDLLDDKMDKSQQDGLVKTSSMVSDLDHNSSESERDSEIEFIRNKVEKMAEELPDERKGLFYEESFEEDLPYVPTTLPLEKSVAVPILPVKQRLQEVR